MTTKGHLGKFSIRNLATYLRSHIGKLLVGGADSARMDEGLTRYANTLDRSGLDAGKTISDVIRNLQEAKETQEAAKHLRRLCFMQAISGPYSGTRGTERRVDSMPKRTVRKKPDLTNKRADHIKGLVESYARLSHVLVCTVGKNEIRRIVQELEEVRTELWEEIDCLVHGKDLAKWDSGVLLELMRKVQQDEEN